MLFLSDEMKTVGNTLKKIGNENHNFVEIDSDYGHDAFLVELNKFDGYVKDVLNGEK